MMGGFECATHLRRDGVQIDVLRATEHDTYAAGDYSLLQQAGIRTVRDGLRWHLIEVADGVYDWSSFLPMLEASCCTGTQVIWDLCHWGVPRGLDVFSPDFIRRFAAFASAAAKLVADRSVGVPFYCPINEVSFWAWIGGEQAHFGPHAVSRGAELKRQLIAAATAAMQSILTVEPRARFLQAEPAIHVVADTSNPEDNAAAASATAAQFETWDRLHAQQTTGLMMRGGQTEGMLDVVGVNFYWDNEWILGGSRTPPGHPLHRPLHNLLKEIWHRYHRPIVISETGAEGMAALGWFGYIAAEVRQAQREGVQVEGICLYPVMDYCGWDDDRHCPCGLIEVSSGWKERRLRKDIAQEIGLQLSFFDVERA